MNNTKDAMYCRLCAKLKQHKTLTNLQTDEKTCQKVVNELSRFNIIIDFQENILPKTVCLLCVKSLERAFVFITAVEQAQAFLSDFILVQINTASDCCDDNIMYEPPDDENGIVDVKEENIQNLMEVNDDDGTNLSEKCDCEVMTEVYNDSDYSVINGNSEEQMFENNHGEGYIPSIEENTDLKNEYVELPDLYHVEDNKKDKLEEELNYEPILLDNTGSSADYIDKQNYSNKGAKNMNKSVQQLQPQECNSERIAPKRLSTTVYSKTNIVKKQKTKKKKHKSSNMSTKNTDTDLEDIKMSWKDYEWKCYYCETLFPNIEELQKHSMQYHNSCNPYQCTDCVTRSSNLKFFMKHVRKHKYYLHYSCYKCFKKFPKVYQSGYHKKKVHEDSDYVCTGCNTPFYSNSELKEHVNKYYKQFLIKTPLDLTCRICYKNTASAQDFRKHVLTHENKKEYVCETCGKCFGNKQVLRAHIVRHSAVKILHPCDICNTSFICVNQLRYHKKIHSGIKPFTCDHCGKSYSRKSYIARHMKTHMDSLLHPCTLCNKKYSSASNLKKHMLQHTGEKPFSCHICPRDFTDLSNRNKHMRRIHGIELARKRQPNTKQQTADDPTSFDLATREA